MCQFATTAPESLEVIRKLMIAGGGGYSSSDQSAFRGVQNALLESRLNLSSIINILKQAGYINSRNFDEVKNFLIQSIEYAPYEQISGGIESFRNDIKREIRENIQIISTSWDNKDSLSELKKALVEYNESQTETKFPPQIYQQVVDVLFLDLTLKDLDS